MTRLTIHAIILTLNEELHIKRCIESILPLVDAILVVDSGSTDRTREIATSLGARVVSNPWVNYASQLNHGIDLLQGQGEWLMRIDADEIYDPASDVTPRQAIEQQAPHIDGLAVKRRIHFMGRRIRFGGIEPSWQLRMWRNGSGRCEQRWMDEHVIVKGKAQKSRIVFADINLNSLNWWTAKHNDYASREAIDILNRKYAFLKTAQSGLQPSGLQPAMRRFLKDKIYLRLPGGLRAVMYFVYRYIFRLGFLDGKPGVYFHLFQGLWYRSLVDAKVLEIESHARLAEVTVLQAIQDKTGYNPLF